MAPPTPYLAVRSTLHVNLLFIVKLELSFFSHSEQSKYQNVLFKYFYMASITSSS
jgi:hypothetical protein